MQKLLLPTLWLLLAACGGADESLQQGRRLLAEGKPKEALTALNDAIEKAPDNALALNTRGVAHFELNDFSNALLDYQQAIRADSTLYQPYFNRARLYAAQGAFEKALTDFSTAARLAPDSAAIFLNRGFIFARQKQPQAALTDFDRAIGLSPRNAEAFFVRGNLLLEQQQYPAAIKDYEQAVALRPSLAGAFHNMGLAYYFTHNPKAACLSWQQAKKLGYAAASEALAQYCN